MSNQQNDTLYESAYEDFWEFSLDGKKFNFVLTELLYFFGEGETMEAFLRNCFHCLWEWDAEGMSQDIEGTIKKYVEAHK
jgi:hypothetical protein